MEELERILREHAKRYPLMQPCDAVKLIYQSYYRKNRMTTRALLAAL